MQEELAISTKEWGWVTGAFVFSYALFEIPSGAMGDRVGPRRVLTRIVSWWSAFTALTGFVSSYYLLLLTRFLFGMGEAGAYPNASIVISRWFPTLLRASATGIVMVASQVGGLLAPLLVVPIQSRFGWRTSFYVFAAIGFAWVVAWYLWFRDSPSEKCGVSDAELDEIGANAVPTHDTAVRWQTAFKHRNCGP